MDLPPRMRRWPAPCLMLVTDRARLRGASLDTVASLAVSGGVNVVQLREKDLPSGDLYRTALELHSILRGRALLLVNGRADVALASGADGVHLPEDGLPIKAVRDIVGESCIIGRSVHSVEAAARAEQDGADYVMVGSIFETASKPGAPAAGIELVRAVSEAGRVPVIAIGGITPENAGSVIQAGADGAAVIGAVMDAGDPKQAAERLRRAIDDAYGLTSL